jgi:hypothetical protein
MTEPQVKDMSGASRNPRTDLIRETSILQLKLLADGLRDALLIPLSLVAALIGLARGGPDCDRELRRVIKLGRRSERWINLFGHQKPLGRPHLAGSMDSIIEQVESTVLDQYRRSRKAGDTEAPAEPKDQS